MSNGTKTLDLHPVISELEKLIQEIKPVVEELGPRGTLMPDPATWLASLEATDKVLRDWCNGFTLDIPSKR